MKLFIVSCLKEYKDDVTNIFKEANIAVFSDTDVIGLKENQPPALLDQWFASGEEKSDSIMLFSFTTSENAEAGVELIKKHNEQSKDNFPIRAFIVRVEKSSCCP